MENYEKRVMYRFGKVNVSSNTVAYRDELCCTLEGIGEMNHGFIACEGLKKLEEFDKLDKQFIRSKLDELKRNVIKPDFESLQSAETLAEFGCRMWELIPAYVAKMQAQLKNQYTNCKTKDDCSAVFTEFEKFVDFILDFTVVFNQIWERVHAEYWGDWFDTLTVLNNHSGRRTKDESNSITGQRKLLYAYIKKTEEFAGFEVLEYFDDGYSGTMFNNRAEFQRLIQDAELGRFECIIVKDFSRFGRDYLEVGNYLEFVFPAMGMRFISVNDNYDSDRNFGVTGGMDVAYKNLIYQLYSMDLSRKVKSARRTRNLSGEYTASFVCYGYKKDPDDKHKLIIDEEAAKVVVEIFSLIIAGYNASEVARILNERKIPTRVQNQWKNGINYVPVHNKGDYMWDNSEVIAIVQNEQYKGIMIQNKCETVGFGDNKKVRKRNKEDWSVVEGAIPRIVSDEMFYEVNKMLRVEARGIEKSTKKRKKNLFICPYCGRKLMNSSAVCTPKLLCPKRRMVRTGECQQIFMLKSEAQDKVLEITKEICRTLIQEEELKKASKDKRKVASDEHLISELKAEYDRISNSTVSCYQSYREGKYTKEEYVQLRKTNQELLADLENQISDLQEKAANQEPDAEEKIEQLTQYSMLEQYDGDVLSNIIDKVLIYNDKDIEVVFKGENFIRNAV